MDRVLAIKIIKRTHIVSNQWSAFYYLYALFPDRKKISHQ